MNENVLDELIDQILKAEEQAMLNGIKTNTIVINEEFDLCKGFAVKGIGQVKEVPPMILGKHVFKAKLPSEYSFALTYYTEQQQSDLEYYKRRCSELEEKLIKIKEDLL